jgi:Ca2+-binding RTX toxin-like protein
MSAIRWTGGTGLVLALSLSLTGLASAAGAPPSCRASASRAEAPNVAASEPVVANTNATPCVTDAAQAAVTEPRNGLTVINPKADTVRSAGIVGASSSIESAGGTPGGTVDIAVGAVSSQETLACQGGASVPGGTSRVDSLSIGGTTLPSVIGSTPVDTTIPTPAGVVRVRANQLVATAAGLTRTALILDLPGGARLTLGEATVGGDACLPVTGTGPGGGGNGSGGGNGNGGNSSTTASPCPKGSEYDVPSGFCVIRQDVRGVQFISVGRPSEGPSGGTVITLTAARKKYHSACLSGPGPKYAVIGTDKADRITGTNRADRILTLGGKDRADGGRGADCIDGGTGNDSLSGGLDRDRVYGMSGGDALNGGAGTDRLSGGTGNDTINGAFGADVVLGGTGRDFINVATSGPAARVSCGAGRDKVRVNYNERKRTTGCETRYVFKDRAKLKPAKR